MHLEVTDATRPESYVRQADDSNDGDKEFLLFGLQQLYPNARYAFGVFDIVSRCPNPKYFSVDGIHQLPGDRCLTLTYVNLSPTTHPTPLSCQTSRSQRFLSHKHLAWGCQTDFVLRHWQKRLISGASAASPRNLWRCMAPLSCHSPTLPTRASS